MDRRALAETSAPRSRLPQVSPEELRIDPRRLQVAYDLLERWTTGPNAPVPGAGVLVGHPVAGRVARCHDGVWLAQRDSAAILVALEASTGDAFDRPVPVAKMRELTERVVDTISDLELVG
jgi:hypothetical protein